MSLTSDCAGSDALTDAALVRRSQTGDTAAFALLYRRHVGAVTAVCRARIADTDAVEDLVQETFARLWAALPRFRGGDQVLHWLRRTAKNACVDHARRRCNSELSLLPAVAESARLSADPASDVVTRQAIGSVLAQLRPVDAALLEEHHLADRPLREMATRWGSTEKSLSVRLTRARRAFAAAGSDLRGLLPFPLWLRLRWPQRPDAMAASGTMAAVVVMNAALSVLLVLPPAGAKEAGERPPAAAEHVVQEDVREAEPSPRVAARRDAAASAQRPAERRDAKRAGDRTGTTEGAIAEVPGTGIRLHSDAPENPDFHYRVEASAGPVSRHAAVKTKGWSSERDEVHRPLCAAVASAPTAATCSTDED